MQPYFYLISWKLDWRFWKKEQRSKSKDAGQWEVLLLQWCKEEMSQKNPKRQKIGNWKYVVTSKNMQ